ncbi:TetR/AcrR family transcriptional regulator [Brevibacterium album]|uniref:TetR/AcrR family transcriptional regulator n=1 Tax=Brevibacterium album TaxID=417948 RepID=UPI0003FCFFE0|nr:TetR family transcriptional regulator C-terminal domain-containing protein [Brevibacterium album]
MPARIDPAQRRGQIVEAAFRLVIAEGITGMSLRKVAEESGLNIGSVRHCFDSHHALLTAAAEEAGNRMGRRLAGHPVERLRGLRGEVALDALQALVETVLPLDEARREEAAVVVELIAASRTMPVFRPIAARMGADLTAVLREALTALEVPEAELAAAQVSAVVGGLTFDALTPHGALSVEQLRTILRAHLRGLLGVSEPG